MAQQAADVIEGRLGETGIASFVVEERLAVHPERLVGVHSRSVVAEDGLGHECHRMPPIGSHILRHILIDLHMVGHSQHLAEANIYFSLAGSADFVVLYLHMYAAFLEVMHHLGAQVLEGVHRREGEIAHLVRHLVAQVGRFVDERLLAARPDALTR